MDIRNQIETLQKLRKRLSEYDYESLSGELDHCLPKIPFTTLFFNNRPGEFGEFMYGGQNVLYRAQVLKDDEAPFKFLERLSYRKDLENISEFGRLNKPHQSIFYASTNIDTACVETFTKGINLERFLKREGLMIVMGHWQIVDKMNLVQLHPAFNALEYISATDKYYKQVDKTKENLKWRHEQLKELIDDDCGYALYQIFSEEISKYKIETHKDYMLGNYYADRVLGLRPNSNDTNTAVPLDGFIYESVAARLSNSNFALLPNTVETKLKFLSADLLWVVYNPREKTMTRVPLKSNVGVNKNGELMW